MTTAAARRKPCERCGGPKPPGRGQKLCASCEPVFPSRGAGRPCWMCGSTEHKAPGKRYCDECDPIAQDAFRARRKARQRKRVLPCRGCKGVKEPGQSVYCLACERARDTRPLCTGCGVRPIRAAHKHYCVECQAVADKARRRKLRERARERRRLDPEASRATQRRYRERQKTKAARAERAEARRLNHRLKAEQAGQTVSVRHVEAARPVTLMPRDVGYQTTLPGPPVAAFVRAAYERANVGGDFATFMRKLGTTDRAVRRWTGGEGVRLDKVESIMAAAGALWFDIFDVDLWPAEYEQARALFEAKSLRAA